MIEGSPLAVLRRAVIHHRLNAEEHLRAAKEHARAAEVESWRSDEFQKAFDLLRAATPTQSDEATPPHD